MITFSVKKSLVRIALIAAASLVALIPLEAADDKAKVFDVDIEDNSFLMEEAYNQGPGVVQFVSTFQYNTRSRSWTYLLVNEYPLISQMHQLSYSLPVSQNAGVTSVGDILLNYRLQILDSDIAAMAPRISVIFPTGSYVDGLGSGGWGIQFNWSASVKMGANWVSHWNLGVTATIQAKNALGQTGNPVTMNYGGSLIYKPLDFLNFLVEVVGTSGETVGATGSIERAETLFINPGIRFAITPNEKLQIVPGICVPLGVGPSLQEIAVLGYLSIEATFW
ncbi:MAG: transporter [Spirochaetota bacterium]